MKQVDYKLTFLDPKLDSKLDPKKGAEKRGPEKGAGRMGQPFDSGVATQRRGSAPTCVQNQGCPAE